MYDCNIMTPNPRPGFRFSMAIAAIFLAATIGLTVAHASDSPRERLLLDFGWKFHLGNDWGIAQDLGKAGTGSGPASASFGDRTWRTVNLPHDWAIEMPFDRAADGSHGFHAVGHGFEKNSVGWYRRTFDLPGEDAGKRLWLEFDGVFRDCTVFVNGWFVGHHESGYSSFRYDITDVANPGGKNVIAVKVDATQFEGWFYEGAGIYRHVWLVKTAPLAIAPDGVFVFSKFENNSPEGRGELHFQTEVLNSQTNSAEASVESEVIAPGGQVISTIQKPATLSARSKVEVDQTASLPDPQLWSPESPKLYKLVTTVESGGQVVDRKETEFGVKTVAFDAEKGFLLNGKPYELKGTCNHQDAAGVGAALPDRLQYFRVEKLKEMGDNAWRTSHNAPTPELLEACDHLGMLVMDENRLLGSDELTMHRLEDQVRRDRNHASVGIWSIANEEFNVQSTPAGRRVAATMQDAVKRLDPTRPVTYPAPVGNEFSGINEIIEVRGWNYHIGGDMDDYHRQHPGQPNVGTEQGSTVSTRGIYANDMQRGYVSAYDDNAPNWAHTAERWWSYFADRPWLSGGFVWTGFDYRGEPTPYDWPCVNSHFGILDTCGFPKDNFYYYQAWWGGKTVLHLLPHWNWPGREGQDVDVRALSNCEEVELFLNGASLGRQTMKKNSELKWKVKYAPGVLSAKGYNDGKLAAETRVETTGEPAAIRLKPDRAAINADGEDVSVITVAVTDAQGRVVPVASNLVEFAVEGPGKILGVGNGDPSCHEPDVYITQTPVRSMPVTGWRWEKIPDPRKSGLPETAEKFDDSAWAKALVESESGPLQAQENGVFRATVTLTDQDLGATAIELNFGMIDEDGWVYINGRKCGESHDWQVSPGFEVKPLLHPGANTIAVTVANYSGPGGVNKGVTLLMPEQPIVPHWQRSVFNGLAQIIVQSSKKPGEIKLTARAQGLTQTVLKIEAQSAPLRPAVTVK
jgi:beta-galactosidase